MLSDTYPFSTVLSRNSKEEPVKKYTGKDKVSVVSNDGLCENETRRELGSKINVKFKAARK